MSNNNDVNEGNPSEEEIVGKHIVFFDGVCNLCTGLTENCVKNDEDNKFIFSPIQSSFAKEVLKFYGIDSSVLNSLYIVSDYKTSNEALRAASCARNFLLLNINALKEKGEIEAAKPRLVQDEEYSQNAKNRYNVCGMRDSVKIPSEETRHKYIL
eukprot:TRINITY_DN9832_c0_g1_i1.p1 TRINITY_DN9832_c0_g1~~TRINITY_DN9832_c0_g1_i1.p1  ORF type:complete len:155 (+),score=41.30 TRINITY_DN9832_c0_g1_i1:36-500(+)